MKSNEGYLDLEKELSDLIGKAENVDEVLDEGANAFTQDLLRLAKPRSQIRRAGHTHMVDSFAYKKSKYSVDSYIIGWGKYYGRMVEEGHMTRGKRKGSGGTKFVAPQPHLRPTWDKNQDKYINLMIKKLDL